MALTKLNDRQLHTLGKSNIATDQELSDAIIAHELASNPHPQYLTTSTGSVTSVNGSVGEVVITAEQINAVGLNKVSAANGVASLDASSNVSVGHLPSYTSVFLEYANFTSLPQTGDPSKYYITLNDNKHYSWLNGSYIEETFGWKDLIGDIKPRTNGVYAPSLKDLTAYNTEFAYSVGDKCECKFHVPHDYVPKTDLFIHVHWTHTGTNIAGELILNLYSAYAKGHQQDAFTNTSIGSIAVSGINITNTPPLHHRVDEIVYSSKGGSASLLNTDLIEVDGFILLTFEAMSVPSVSGSIYTNDIYIISLDIHYRSTNLPTKNKSPNFYS